MLRVLAVLLLAACATTSYSSYPYLTLKYEGEWWDYEVSATETITVDGSERCVSRTIILRLKPGFHLREVVSYVRATDRQCDDSLDELWFRSPIDQGRFTHQIAEDVISAFYAVKYGGGR